MTSSGRELVKWIALICMTADHLAKVVWGGYVPVLSEAGRVAFPLFALVMAFNLAQPGVDCGTSLRRLALWAVIAQPVYALVFGYLLPFNVLMTFAVAAASIWAIQRRHRVLAVALLVAAPALVDYQWTGVWFVVAAWWWYSLDATPFVWLAPSGCYPHMPVPILYARLPLPILFAIGMLCSFNGNGWALLALPLLTLADHHWRIPRRRWAFYAYYVGHLAILACCVSIFYDASL